jgi:SAM-dependent methyltransferase
VKRDLLRLLACPECGGELVFAALGHMPLTDSSEIYDGTLACKVCRRQYALEEGVPRLASAGLVRAARKTRDAFAFEWSRYPGSLPEDNLIFLEEVQLPASAFAGKLVLDAGCGMGRYSVVALSLGAEVVALDLSDSLLRLAALSPEQPKLHVAQGNLLAPPLKPRQFDVVYSHGVLHHTSDTRAAFKRVAALVKPGGYLSVWLYGKAGPFAQFATNPLKHPSGWTARHRRAAWVIVGARHWVSDAIRLLTTRLPMRLVYLLCYPLAFLGVLPGLKYLTFSVHRDFKVRVIENFDWISPPYQWHHTKEELAGWFAEEGFEVLKVLPHGLVPKPGILGRKRDARS